MLFHLDCISTNYLPAYNLNDLINNYYWLPASYTYLAREIPLTLGKSLDNVTFITDYIVYN